MESSQASAYLPSHYNPDGGLPVRYISSGRARTPQSNLQPRGGTCNRQGPTPSQLTTMKFTCAFLLLAVVLVALQSPTSGEPEAEPFFFLKKFLKKHKVHAVHHPIVYHPKPVVHHYAPVHHHAPIVHHHVPSHHSYGGYGHH
ncbi:uncharacterized protein LOC143021313 [Oratosquilla oratoria]|uniref:uncharacterized protein LOC143021313 n=1 Tax=Oratosquilla oratoria TaxID=337810 RepID=UPI003F771114